MTIRASKMGPIGAVAAWFCLCGPVTVSAQADLPPPPPGWQQNVANGVVTLVNTPQTVAITYNAEGSVAPTGMAQYMDQAGVCTGLASAAPTAIMNGRAMIWTTTGGSGCWLLSGQTPQLEATVLVLGVRGPDAAVLQIATDRLAGLLGPEARPAPVDQRAASNAGDADARLKQAVAAIPAANRPVAAVSHGTSSYSGWPPSYVYRVTARMLFGNGLASTCADWDPGQFAPTRGQAPFAEDGCDLIPWRKTTGTPQFQSEDGSWSSADSAEGLFGFKPGERIDVDFGNVGGIGFDFGGGAGGISTSTLSGGTLRMTADGRIAVGDWSTTVISGSRVGGGSSRSSGPRVGRYYLDGHIIAIIDENGDITRGFIAALAGDGGRRIGHIYLNGRHYWDRSD